MPALRAIYFADVFFFIFIDQSFKQIKFAQHNFEQ